MAPPFSGLKAALQLLWEQREKGSNQGKAAAKGVEVQALLGADLATADLRRLVQNGYLEVLPSRRREEPATGAKPERTLGAKARVILSSPGAALASQILYPLSKGWKPKLGFPDLTLPAAPSWDQELLVLDWGEKIVERFTRPAPNLVALLNALQKHDWPPWTPNPFRTTAKHTGQYLLREAIKNWNYSPIAKFIRLHGDGSGTGFLWERLV